MTTSELRERLDRANHSNLFGAGSKDEYEQLAEDAVDLAEQLEAENKRLRGLLGDVLDAIGPPKVVYIGSPHNRYEVSYEAGIDDPIKRSRAALEGGQDDSL